MLVMERFFDTLLNNPITPSGPIPTAQDPDGVYPYESYSETSRRPELKSFQMIAMENEAIRVVVCPDLGGKVYSITHKASGKEALYTAPIVRPVRILPRQFYIGGGIEVSFPISHSPVQAVPVSFKTKELADRVYIWCGETELRFGMQWTVEYSLGVNDAFLTQRTFFHNPTTRSHPWMSWSNAGIPARDDTEFHFPGGPVLYHGEEMKTIDWRREGPRRQKDMKRMAGFFWREPDCCAFGAYTPSLGCGLYHIADPAQTPGIKLWTDGVGEHQAFVTQWTLNDEQCLEIQAGPLIDQSIKQVLNPGETHVHEEFWIPSDRPLDIHELELPLVKLLPVARIPLFGFARKREVHLWQQLLSSHERMAVHEMPLPPGTADNRWAPSGMERLGAALEWACRETEGESKDAWLFQAGAWFAGNDEIDEALIRLDVSGDDRAKALAGRLYRRIKRDHAAAAACYRKISSAAFALHPQIVFERDLALEKLGPSFLAEREHWLHETQALTDEWLIERRAALLFDQGRFAEAKQLLESTSFQLIHQRYARTKLWRAIMQRLDLEHSEAPGQLGEDDLFAFGAYREYQEEE
ncbi:DUF5107 domain-containing protein [Cohnella soli]|uniref:DUF5107 domain-containing protein n=1 Tax=Cohnella soli TaxID=425005 RepID=A0ABW0I100_9BACL